MTGTLNQAFDKSDSQQRMMDQSDSFRGKKLLVTGGNGFLGRAIVRMLLQDGAEVVSFSRTGEKALERSGCKQILGDLADASAIHHAVRGVDAVIHTAAKAGVWGSYASYEAPNIWGTRHLLDAMRAHRVGALVYTSTPSVTFDGADQDGVDESCPYTDRFYNPYQKTKKIAECMVLEAATPDLRTIALRPHLIWGPGDPHLVPRIIDRARQGKLRLVGSGDKLVDAVFVDNAALAHVVALRRLMSDEWHLVNGKAYFISNHEPWPMRDIIGGIVKASGQELTLKSVPPRLALALGALLEQSYRLARRRDEPVMTKFVALQLMTAHWFKKDRPLNELGYAPKVSMAQGMKLLADSIFESKP